MTRSPANTPASPSRSRCSSTLCARKRKKRRPASRATLRLQAYVTRNAPSRAAVFARNPLATAQRSCDRQRLRLVDVGVHSLFEVLLHWAGAEVLHLVEVPAVGLGHARDVVRHEHRVLAGGALLGVVVVLAAMPVATNGTMFCYQYGGDAKTMAQGTFITTVLALVTIPLLATFSAVL